MIRPKFARLFPKTSRFRPFRKREGLVAAHGCYSVGDDLAAMPHAVLR
jgi:hypothetical protein